MDNNLQSNETSYLVTVKGVSDDFFIYFVAKDMKQAKIKAECEIGKRANDSVDVVYYKMPMSESELLFRIKREAITDFAYKNFIHATSDLSATTLRGSVEDWCKRDHDNAVKDFDKMKKEIEESNEENE